MICSHDKSVALAGGDVAYRNVICLLLTLAISASASSIVNAEHKTLVNSDAPTDPLCIYPILQDF